MQFRLSTSQTPVQFVFPCNVEKSSIVGGFGTVVEDGYGVSYLVVGEDMGEFCQSSSTHLPSSQWSQRSHHLSIYPSIHHPFIHPSIHPSINHTYSFSSTCSLLFYSLKEILSNYQFPEICRYSVSIVWRYESPLRTKHQHTVVS